MANGHERWEDVRDILYTINNTKNVYYDPPTSIQMKFPCFRFNMNNTDVKFADNFAYLRTKRWTVTYITRDVEDIDPVVKGMLDTFKYCSQETQFKSDNLQHVVFNLYY